MADSKKSLGASQNKTHQRRLAGRKSSGIRGGSTAVLVGGLAILACAEAVRWIVKRRRAAKQITRNSEQVESKSTTVDESCCSPSSDVVVSNGIPDLGFEEKRKDQSSKAGICVGNGALEDPSDAGKLAIPKELGTPDAAKVFELGSEGNGKDHNSSDETNADNINGVLEGMEGSTCGHEHEEEDQEKEEVMPTPQDDHAPVFDEKLGLEEHAQVDMDNALPPRASREELTSSTQTELILENKELTPLLEMSQIATLGASSIEALDADSKPEHEAAKGLRESVAVYVDKEQVNDLTQEVSIKQVISCNSSDCMKDSVKKQVELCDCVVNHEVNGVREQKTCEEPAEGELEVKVALISNPEAADNLVDKVNELKTREELEPKVTAAAVINKIKAADGLTFLHAEIVQLSTDHKSKSTSGTVECSTDESKQAASMEQKQQIEVHGPAEDMKKHAQPVAEITLVPSVDKVKLKLESLTNPQELAQFAATPAEALKKVIKPLEILKKAEEQHKGVRHRPWIEDLWHMVPVAMEVAIMFLFIGFIFMLLKHLPGLSPTGYPSD